MKMPPASAVYAVSLVIISAAVWVLNGKDREIRAANEVILALVAEKGCWATKPNDDCEAEKKAVDAAMDVWAGRTK